MLSVIACLTCRAATSSSSSSSVLTGCRKTSNVGFGNAAASSRRSVDLANGLVEAVIILFPDMMDVPKLSARGLFLSLVVAASIGFIEVCNVALFGSKPIAFSLKYVDLVVSCRDVEVTEGEVILSPDGVAESRVRRDVLACDGENGVMFASPFMAFAWFTLKIDDVVACGPVCNLVSPPKAFTSCSSSSKTCGVGSFASVDDANDERLLLKLSRKASTCEAILDSRER